MSCSPCSALGYYFQLCLQLSFTPSKKEVFQKPPDCQFRGQNVSFTLAQCLPDGLQLPSSPIPSLLLFWDVWVAHSSVAHTQCLSAVSPLSSALIVSPSQPVKTFLRSSRPEGFLFFSSHESFLPQASQSDPFQSSLNLFDHSTFLLWKNNYQAPFYLLEIY